MRRWRRERLNDAPDTERGIFQGTHGMRTRIRRGGFPLVLALSLVSVLSFVVVEAGDESRTRPYVETLASEKFAGRLAGSDGERLAADYLVSELKKIGAKPLPGLKDFREAFDFTAGTKDGGSTIGVSWTANGQDPERGTSGSARALSFSDDGDLRNLPIVFAGYGIVVPESQNFAYDSYSGLDVTNKAVLVLRYFPEDADMKTKATLARYSDLRYKAMAARQHGAKAVIVVTGPRSPNAGELVPMSFDTAIAGSGILAASVIGSVADAIFKQSGHRVEEAQKALDTANPHVPGFAIPNTVVSLKVSVIREKQSGNNILAYLPANDAVSPESRAVAKPYVILGAHYDHLGHGDHGNSLAQKGEAGQTHFGADDNASGTAAVLAAGAALAKQPRRRNVVLALWSGEELGLLGSSAFAAKPPIAIDQVEAYLNFDMVGRMQDNKLVIQGMGTSAVWPKLVEQTNVAAGFDLALQDDPYQPTDIASFNQTSIPSLTIFTGTHADYHRPTDTANKIDYEDLDRVAEFAVALTDKLEALDTAPSFVKVQPKTDQRGRAGVRVFTGTIPDYSSDVKGLLLGGVIAGGPAEQSGLQKGDVIVEIAGQSITNIYDYTYALDVLKIGQPAKVVYLRNGARRETTITPSARK